MTTSCWTVAELAHHLSTPYDTVQKWPSRGYGPPTYMVVRGRRLYLPATVAVWQRSLLKVVA
jgi:hypothetical protein